MNTLNFLLGSLVELIFEPMAGWPAQLSLVLWSVVTGIVMAWVFRHTSNQAALAAAANRVRAQLFAIKLFKDDLGVLFRCQVRLMKSIAARLWHSLPPLLVLLVPIVLLLVQLARWYEYRPLLPDEAAIVQLQLSDSAWQTYRNATLDAPESVAVEIVPLRDDELKTVYWRIRPTSAAPATLRWRLGEQLVEKRLAVADNRSRLLPVSIRRPGSSWMDRLWHPSEPGFAAESPVRGIEVQHPRRSTPMFGFDVPWWLTFLVVSMLAALVARPWLKVQF